MPQYEVPGEFPVEHGYIWTSCASVENGNPLFWDDEVAAVITGGPIAPPTMLSVWFRPHHWAPGRTDRRCRLQVHFDLKDRFELPEAVMTDNTLVFHEPVRPGDVLRTRQVLRSVSGPKTTKLGTGRFWVIDVEYHNQRGELVGVESYTGFGYRHEGTDAERSHSWTTVREGTDCRRCATTSPPPPSCSARSRHATGGRCTTTTTSPPSATARATSS